MQKAIKLHRCTNIETKKKPCSLHCEQKTSYEGELNYGVIHPSPGDDRHEDKKHEEEEDDSFRRRLYQADGAAPRSACCTTVSFLSAPPYPQGAAHVSFTTHENGRRSRRGDAKPFEFVAGEADKLSICFGVKRVPQQRSTRDDLGMGVIDDVSRRAQEGAPNALGPGAQGHDLET
ncbi:hypothetical protein GW17_00020110 [Ensete ventricosum]|nr:hypothetical protein GW17_00020110 [Ensete ventricosum]